VSAAAEAAGISRVTAHKWLTRGRAGALQDRSSRPRRSPNRTPPWWEEIVVMLRRTGMTGPKIAHDLKLPAATVARILARHDLRRLRDLQPQERPERYEHRRPGDLIHLDVKKLGGSSVQAIASTATARRRFVARPTNAPGDSAERSPESHACQVGADVIAGGKPNTWRPPAILQVGDALHHGGQAGREHELEVAQVDHASTRAIRASPAGDGSE
jgi:transposase